MSRGEALQAHGRHRRAARQPGARRRGAEAVGGDAGADAASGRAVVFENIEHYKQRVDDPALDVDETCVMVLKNCGPKGYPGMAEVGNMPLPQKLLKKGVRDMVRISDARMSGTAYGTVVLHTAPEAAAGGPLALVRDGDMIELDVDKRRLHLGVTDDELAVRRKAWKAPEPLDGDAAISGSMSIMCCRPIAAATWISWSASAARRSPGNRTEGPSHNTHMPAAIDKLLAIV